MNNKYFTDKSGYGIYVWTGIFMALFLIPFLIRTYDWDKTMAIFGSYLCTMVVVGLILFLTTGFYPEIQDNRFKIRNGLYKFCIAELKLSDIESVHIYQNRSIFVKILIKGEKHHKRYALGCMSVKSIQSFAEELSSKDINVTIQ